MQIFDSYIDAGQQLPQRDKERFYTALIEFIAYGVEPTLDGAAAAVFTAIKPSLVISKKRAEAGRRGGNANAKNNGSSNFASKQNESKSEASDEANEQLACEFAHTITNTSTNTSKGVGGAGEGESDSEEIAEIVAHLNAAVGKSYKPTTPKTRSLIRARMREGFTVDDFKTVIDKKARAWLGTEFAQYLRPKTLFGTNFEGYLNEIQVNPNPKTYEEVGRERFSEYNRAAM